MGIRESCRKFYYCSHHSQQFLYYPHLYTHHFFDETKINGHDTMDMCAKTYHRKRWNQMLQTKRWVLNNRNNGVLCLTNKQSYLLVPLVYWLWLYFPFYFWKNNSLLIGQMHPTTRSTKEQNSTLVCAKIKGKSKRKREKRMTSDSTITITLKDFKLWFSRSMHQCKPC